jgi:glycosyltransferase involved in cell wall biosynthesis
MSRAVAGGPPVILVSHGFQGNYERGFSNGLCDIGVDVTLISSDRTDHAGLRAGVRSVNLRGSQEERRSRFQKLLNMLCYHARLLFFVLCHPRSTVHIIGLIDPPLLYGVLEGAWFRLFSRRYVLTVHDLLPHDRHTAWNQRLFGWSFRLPHHLVVHTEKMRQALMARYGVPSAQITVMEHGIEPTPASPCVMRPVPAIPQLLFFGKVARYKGLDLLLDALDDALGGRVSLRIVGIAPDKSLQQALEDRITKHPWREHIVWRNEFIAEEEVPTVFYEADVLVLPYRHIDQSGVLFQALRHGLPMVATRVGSFAHYISPELGEICEPEDALDLRKAIGRLVERLAAVSRDLIAEKGRQYEWPRTVGVLEHVYAPSAIRNS